MMTTMKAYLWSELASKRRTENAQTKTNNDSSDALAERQTKLSTKHAQWDSAYMASHREPEEEDIPDRGRVSFLIRNPINALSKVSGRLEKCYTSLTDLRLDPELPVHELFEVACFSQYAKLLLDAPCFDDLADDAVILDFNIIGCGESRLTV